MLQVAADCKTVSMRNTICCSTFSQCTISQAPFRNTEKERDGEREKERESEIMGNHQKI